MASTGYFTKPDGPDVRFLCCAATATAASIPTTEKCGGRLLAQQQEWGPFVCIEVPLLVFMMEQWHFLLLVGKRRANGAGGLGPTSTYR